MVILCAILLVFCLCTAESITTSSPTSEVTLAVEAHTCDNASIVCRLCTVDSIITNSLSSEITLTAEGQICDNASAVCRLCAVDSITTNSLSSEITLTAEGQICDAHKKEVFSCLPVQRCTENNSVNSAKICWEWFSHKLKATKKSATNCCTFLCGLPYQDIRLAGKILYGSITRSPRRVGVFLLY